MKKLLIQGYLLVGWVLGTAGRIGAEEIEAKKEPPLPVAAIVEVVGSVKLQRVGEAEPCQAETGHLLFPGDHLCTGEKAAVTLVLADGSGYPVGAQQDLSWPFPPHDIETHPIRIAPNIWESLVRKYRSLQVNQVSVHPAFPGTRGRNGEIQPCQRPMLIQPCPTMDLNGFPTFGQVLATRPLFFWSAVSEATNYSVRLYEREGQPLWAGRFSAQDFFNRVHLQMPDWGGNWRGDPDASPTASSQVLLCKILPEVSLTPGKTYQWQILAYTPRGIQRSVRASFRVATEPEAAAVQKSLTTLTGELQPEAWASGHHVLRGLVFESQWLFANALWEYQQAIEKQPADPGVKRLVSDLYDRTEAY